MEDKILASYRALSFLKAAREGFTGNEDEEGEGKFGLVPPSTDPNNALSKTIQHGVRANLEEGPRAHPLLSKSAQFSGIDRRLTADPQVNKDAQEHYPQLRLQQKNQHRQRPSPPPRLIR